MKKYNFLKLSIALMLLYVLTGCQGETAGAEPSTVKNATEITSISSSGCSSSSLPAEDETIFTPSADDLIDYAPWYDDMQDNVIVVRVRTVTQAGVCEIGDYRGCTLTDVNNDTNFSDEYRPEIRVDISAPGLIDEGLQSNAVLRIKGKSTRSPDQKSYRIKLDSKTNLWRGERYFQLNKHPYDATRLRNKLSFDLFRGINNFASLKTQFVHLFIDNVNYGLFTHIEQVDENYMLNRNFDEDDNIFKAQNFTFHNDEDLALDVYGNPVNKRAFDLKLESKNGDNYYKFIEMLQAVTNEENNFRAVFDKFFNRNNYLTWMAINILTDNIDTVSQNYYLYNPKNSEKFYFTPWDYDDGWGTQYQNINMQDGERVPESQKGIGKWWEVPLHQQFLSDPNNRESLERAVLEVREKYFNEAIVNIRANQLKPLVKPYISSNPDLDDLYVTAEYDYYKVIEWESEVAKLYDNSLTAEQEFFESLKKPMPYWTTAYYEGGTLVVDWDKSYSFTNEKITYSMLIATEPTLVPDSILVDVENLNETIYFKSIDLDEGRYYIKVTAVDESGNIQESLDIYFEKSLSSDPDAPDTMYSGVFELIVQ
ncbi:MAG: CotH kinase family protein [Campylobacterota bacterium]|nr:CotH kinase family protein [Campylobacterota bacterium]